jgi:murein DD-endopeptidase MepM/ murein hydrolase activator NlpD
MTNMNTLLKILLILFLVSYNTNLFADDANAQGNTSEEKQEESSITKWIIQNQEDFAEIIEKNAQDTRTRWFKVEEQGTKSLDSKSESNKNEETAQNEKVQNDTNSGLLLIKHTVQKGETLYSVSRKYAVTVPNILLWNNLTLSSNVKSGDILSIYVKDDSKIVANSESNEKTKQPTVDLPPLGAPAEQAAEGDDSPEEFVGALPDYKYYRVKKGDTSYSIARYHGMSAAEFFATNNLKPEAPLSVDTIVKVKSNYNNINSQKASAIVKDGFIWPVVGRLIASFGPHNSGTTNEGINIAAKVGTNIKATQDGIVIYAGNALKNYGNIILIQHDNSWVSAYAHVDSIIVEKGSKVKKGEVIAKVGNFPDKGQSQLHFELRYKIKPMDPLQYLTSYR